MTGKANLERAKRLLATADAVLAAEPPGDELVLLALLDLALKRDTVRANLHWSPVPGVDEVEAAVWKVSKVLKTRLEEVNADRGS
jgi:hypothetical protein